MPLHLSHKVHSKYLDVVIEGERTSGEELEEMIRIWQGIFELSNQYGVLQVLSRNKAAGRFPLNAQINMAMRMEDMGCTKSHRIACLAYSNQLFDDQQLIVKYAQAQGYNGQLFDDEQEALTWLLQSPAQDQQKRELTIP